MARFEEVLPALRDGKKIRRSSWDASSKYIIASVDGDRSFIMECFHDVGNITYPSMIASELFTDDWEIVPEPNRVADYLVPMPAEPFLKDGFPVVLKYHSTNSVKPCDTYYRDTFPIGQQPGGSVMVPGSERNVENHPENRRG